MPSRFGGGLIGKRGVFLRATLGWVRGRLLTQDYVNEYSCKW